MNANAANIQSLATSLGLAHQLLGGIMAQLDDESAAVTLPGAGIGPPAATLAHAIYGEDLMVNELVRGRDAILTSGDWGSVTGIPGPIPAQTPEWLVARYHLSGLRSYADAVFTDTMEWLVNARPEEFAHEVPTPFGTMVPADQFLTAFCTVHLMLHGGEIAALLGVQGHSHVLPM